MCIRDRLSQYYTAKYSRINSYLKLQRWTEYSNYPLQHLPALIPDFNTTVAETHIFTVCITAPNDSYDYHPGLIRIVTLET